MGKHWFTSEDKKLNHYLVTDKNLAGTKEDKTLREILPSFPNSQHIKKWQADFLAFQQNQYSADLLAMAANARDGIGCTMLGVACYYGLDSTKELATVQKLIDLGADVNALDATGQPAVYHAIEKIHDLRTINQEGATAVLSCLLENGVRLDDASITPVSGAKVTPLDYARKIGCTAAVACIEAFIAAKAEQAQAAEVSRALTPKSSYPTLLNKFGCYQKKLTVDKLAGTFWKLRTSERLPAGTTAADVEAQFSRWAEKNPSKVKFSLDDVETTINRTFSTRR